MLPKEVSLSGVLHSVDARDDAVRFSELGCVYGCPSRIEFEKRDDGWYLSFESHDDCAKVAQVLKAWSFIAAQHYCGR